MRPRILHANADYTVVDRAPLELAAGDAVKVGPADRAWPGWVWVSRPDGRGSYVPEEMVERRARGGARMKLPFNARDLSVKKGESVRVLREAGGWFWCRADDNREGWLPEFLLRAAKRK